MKRCCQVLQSLWFCLMNKYLTIFLLLSFSVSAEVVTTIGEYSYGGELSRNDGCALAKEKAKLKALEKVLGQKISSEEIESCSEVDGKTDCERNQWFLSSFNGEIIDPVWTIPDVTSQKLNNGEDYYTCEIKLKANVKQTAQLLDPSFDFNVKLNERNFREGEELKIDIELNEPIFLTIFQILPYEKKDYKVHKLFPNPLLKNNFIDKSNISLPPKGVTWKAEFPKNVKKDRVEEYLLFIGSSKEIKWLNKYAEFEDIKKAYTNQKLVNYLYKTYTIIN